MQRLVQAGLFGKGLVSISTPKMVGRYNDALRQLGIEPTTLTSFEVDGIGWSWQIAREKGNMSYLCAGPTNPMGVILTPSQRSKPIWMPFSSYERQLLGAYFELHHNAITDITATTFLGLDIDQELTRYESPYDLLRVRYVVLRSVAGGLFDAAHEQHGLIERFQEEPTGWFDASLRAQLVESGRTWGDLRMRRIDIPPFQVPVSSYYTNAFGGVFILRSRAVDKALLIAVDASQLRKLGGCEEYALDDSNLAEHVLKEGLVEINLRWYRKHPEVLREKCDSILADLLGRISPEINFGELKMAQRRAFAARHADELPEVYHMLERFSLDLRNGGRPKIEKLDPQLSAILLRPHDDLSETDQEAVWMLLCRLQLIDMYRFYLSDRNRFFAEYQTWPDAKRAWAVDVIRKHYVPRMSQ